MSTFTWNRTIPLELLVLSVSALVFVPQRVNPESVAFGLDADLLGGVVADGVFQLELLRPVFVDEMLLARRSQPGKRRMTGNTKLREYRRKDYFIFAKKEFV